MGSFSYGGKYPAALNWNGAGVTYLKFNNVLVWIKPGTMLVNMTAAANLSYTAPISGTYRVALVGGGGTKNDTNGGGGGSGGYCTFDIALSRGAGLNFHCGGANDNSTVVVSGATHTAYAGGAGNGYYGGYLNREWICAAGSGGGHTDNGANGNAGASNGTNGASVYDGRGAGGGGVGLCRMWLIGG